MTASAAQGPFTQSFTAACLIALFGVTLACSLFFTPLPLFGVLGCMAATYFFTRPYKLLLTMVFLIPFNFVFKIGPIPLAAELLKVFIWIPVIFHMRATKKRMPAGRYSRSVFVLALLLGISLLSATDFGFSLKECVRLGSNIGLLYVVPYLVDSREKVFQVLRVLTYSTLVVAAYGFYQYAIHDFGALFWIVNPRLSSELAPGRSTFWEWRNRITSVLTSEMELGHYLNLCIPISVALWLQGRVRRLKWLLAIVALLAALVLTFTFGAWASLIATTVLFIVLLREESGRKLLVGAGTAAAAGALVVMASPLRTFIATKLFSHNMGSFAWDLLTRLDGWLFAFQTWLSHPLFGVGAGNFQALQYEHDFIHSAWAPTGTSPHETYLYILAQFGAVGFVAMLAIVLGALRSDWNLRADPKLGLVALALAFALTVNLIGWFSDDSTFFSPHAGYLVWVFIGMSEAVRALALRMRVAAGASPQLS
ncbi:MAG: O-antigen ligase family protein [Candidatus Acidiferrales bacterium]